MTSLPPFQRLLDEHAAEVMGVLRGAVGRVDAEDCFQETFLSALRAYPGLSSTDNLRGWLLTIAHRKAIDHHRANGRRPLPVAEVTEVAIEDPAPKENGLWDLVGTLPPPCATPATSPTPRSPLRWAARPRRRAAACTRESND